jgi:AraC-like DNA-binding protein
MIAIDFIRLDQGMNWYEETSGNSGSFTYVAVTYGRCVYWLNGEKTVLDRGDFLLIPAGIPYYGKSVPTVFHEKIVVRFTCESSAVRSLPILSADAWVKTKAGSLEWAIERLRVIVKEWTERVAYADIRASAVLLEVLTLWCRELERGRMRSETLGHAERMKQYIQNHYRDRVSKDALGAVIGRSPNHAAALFHRATGQTISAYVHAVRMRTAVYMLEESLLTVNEIAEYLGYSDVSYFHRVFKRTYGHSPAKYVKH